MIIGLLKEKSGENRVSVLPEVVVNFIKLKAEVWFETEAGDKAFHGDTEYLAVGAQLKSRAEILSGSDVLLHLNPIAAEDISKIKSGAVAIGVYQPLFNFMQIKNWALKNITSFSLDMLPRSTRAQGMDVLSSQSNLAGYKAAIYAASIYPRFFPLLMTAAGTVSPAKILILGAGVAGLQAIATCKRLGAVVEVFDSRAASKEEVMSLGAKFIEVEGAADASTAGGYAVEQTEEYKVKQRQLIHDAVLRSDIVITTAQIPGKKAPILITAEMLQGMRRGSIVIDIAASTGGNCEVTQNNKDIVYHGVTVVGNSNFPSTMPVAASRLYGKNVFNFLKLLIDEEGKLNLNFEDELIKGACITHNGLIVNERVKELVIQLAAAN